MFKMTLGIPQADNLSSNCIICNLVHALQQQYPMGHVYTGGLAKSLGMYGANNLSPSTKPSLHISIPSWRTKCNACKAFTD